MEPGSSVAVLVACEGGGVGLEQVLGVRLLVAVAVTGVDETPNNVQNESHNPILTISLI